MSPARSRPGLVRPGDGNPHCVHPRIEDYAIIGDEQTAALVGLDGSVDWLCLPRFDSAACFARLLGDEDNGHWRIAPKGSTGRCARRAYRPDTLVLDTEWETDQGNVRVTDLMPQRERAPDLVRVVEGLSGRVTVRSTLRLRFDYGTVMPWVRRSDGHRVAVAGPDSAWLRSEPEVHTWGEDFGTHSEFTVAEGEKVAFVLTWHPSHEPRPRSSIRTRRWRAASPTGGRGRPAAATTARTGTPWSAR